MKLTYQYIGGVVSKLLNMKKETFVGVLQNHPSITAIDRSHQSDPNPPITPIDRSDQSELLSADCGLKNDTVALEEVSEEMV